jgi:hypothetical protein
MSLTDLLWLATAAYGVHILEEYQLNWRDWVRAVIGLPVEWSDFYVVNALVIVFGVVAANLARWPGLALAFPALMLINATFFHVLPFARTGGRFSPGLATAVVLFYPIGIACYWRASHDGTLRARARRFTDGEPDRSPQDQKPAVFPAGPLSLPGRTRWNPARLVTMRFRARISATSGMESPRNRR